MRKPKTLKKISEFTVTQRRKGIAANSSVLQKGGKFITNFTCVNNRIKHRHSREIQRLFRPNVVTTQSI
ncbi:unnamed protein product [Brassica oleracea]